MHLTTKGAAIVAAIGLAVAAAGVTLAPTVASATRAGAPDSITNCTDGGPCITGNNSGTGPGVKGASAAGLGVLGQTTFNSTGKGNGTAGVSGQDKSGSGSFDAGVRGVSSRGYGVIGESGTGVGVDAIVTAGAGNAIEAFNTGGGNLFQAFNYKNQSVFLLENSGNILASGSLIDLVGVAGGEDFKTSTGGYFVGTGVGVEGSNQAGKPNGTAVMAEGYGGPLYRGNNSNFVDAIAVDDAGNMTITGLIFTAGSCSGGCSKPASPGAHLVSYTPRESLPTMEDFGEGRMVNGEGYVKLDPTFASGTDLGASYMVFITPEGDSRGVYVTSKSPAGFSVHENQGGRSTLTFSWRIVAKPYGISAKRLPLVQMQADASSRHHR